MTSQQMDLNTVHHHKGAVTKVGYGFLSTSQSLKCLYEQSQKQLDQQIKENSSIDQSKEFQLEKTQVSAHSQLLQIYQSLQKEDCQQLSQPEREKFEGLNSGTLTRIQMDSNLGYRHQRLSNNEFSSQLWSELVLISYQAQWEDRLISDTFLWPRSNRGVREMKIFALHFLAEHLGEDFNKYESHQTEWPQLDISQGSEHLIQIALDICWEGFRLQDKFLWDISNPDNSPEEFAFQLSQDSQLPPIFNSLIALQIRRQISNYCLKCAQTFKEGVSSHPETFLMPITYITIKSKPDLQQNLLPQKRSREDVDTEDLLSKIGQALKNKAYMPKNTTPSKKHKVTPLKNGHHQPDLANGYNMTKNTSSHKVKNQPNEQFIITLQKNHQGLYSIVNEAHEANDENQMMKISLNSCEKQGSSNSTLIKIPVIEKDLAQISTHHSNDSSSSKITLDLKTQSPLIKQKGFDNVKGCSTSSTTYSSKSHLISIDLKSIYTGTVNRNILQEDQLNSISNIEQHAAALNDIPMQNGH